MTTIAATAAARAALAATREKGCDPSEPWPDCRPIEAEVPEPRPYPLEHLPELVRKAIQEIAHDAQAPVPMAAVSVLTACAVATQHIADVQVAHAIRYPANLASLTIARSGDRKSTVDRLATKALRDWPTSEAAAREREAAARARAARKAHELEMRGIEQAIAAASRGAKRKSGAPSVEELRARLATLQATPQPLAVEPDLLVEDASAEALRVHLARHRPSAGLFTAEAGLLLGGAGSSGERALGFLATINQAFDGRLGIQARITRDRVPAFHCRLSVCLAVQPEVLRAWLAGDGALARGIGVLGRFLFVGEPSLAGSRLFRHSSSGDATASLVARQKQCLERPVTLRSDKGDVLDLVTEPVSLSRAAFSVWRDYHDRVELAQAVGEDFYRQGELAGRSAELAARVALVLHLLTADDFREPITERTMIAGVAVAEWHLRAALDHFATARQRAVLEDAELLATWLAKRHSSPSLHDLTKLVPYRLRNRRRREAAIAELAARGLARLEEHAGGVTRLVLRPDEATRECANVHPPAASAASAASPLGTAINVSKNNGLGAPTEAAARLRPPAASAAAREGDGSDPPEPSPVELLEALEAGDRGRAARALATVEPDQGVARQPYGTDATDANSPASFSVRRGKFRCRL